MLWYSDVSAYNIGLYFRLYPLRFSFVARESIYFPPGKPANILRGAFGTIFRRLACVSECTDARHCDVRDSCPYARMFEPSSLGRGPSGLADWPRPFVFRATHLDGCTLDGGQSFFFDLNLFDMRSPAIAHLVQSFAQLAREGVGPRRGRADLVEVSRLSETGEPAAKLYDGSVLSDQSTDALRLDLTPLADGVQRVRVRFLTPTELKGSGQQPGCPAFGVLAARIRDRLSTLRSLYDDGPLDMDFRAFAERASRIRLLSSDIRHVDAMRRSSRTGQVHSIGGFAGEAEYEGDLAEFVPYLRAAKWTGVGRQTVWGKGELEVSVA